jgi:hypothetical protein
MLVAQWAALQDDHDAFFCVVDLPSPSRRIPWRCGTAPW